MMQSSCASRPSVQGVAPGPVPQISQPHPESKPVKGKASARIGRPKDGKPEPERKQVATSTSTSTSTPPTPATRLKQRGRAAPATEGRPGPATEFLDKLSREQEAMSPLLGVRFDEATQTAIIALDSAQYFAERLASVAGTPTPELMDELSLFARKMTLEGSDATAALVYSTLLDNANAPALAQALVQPVFRSLLQGPPFMPPERLSIAVQSMCALFPDCRPPDEWLQALVQAARVALAPGKTQAIADVTTAVLFAVTMVQANDAARASLDSAVLRLAVQACGEDADRPIGLVAWLNHGAVHSQPMDLAAKALDELRRQPALSPQAVATVLVTLSAGTVIPLSTDGSDPAAPLGLILPWALQLPDTHRGMALAGIAQGMAQALQPGQETAAHLRSVLRVIGEVESLIQPSDAQGAVGEMLSLVIASPLGAATTGSHKKVAGPKAGPASRDSKDGKAGTGTAKGTGSVTDERWPSQMLAGLRAALVGPKRNARALEHRLPLLGGALALMAGGRDMAAATLGALLAGLVKPPIPVRDAGQILSGLAAGVGGPAMKEALFHTFVEAMGQADLVRGAMLACHFCGAVEAAGAQGRKRAVPIAQRMTPAGGHLALPLALGCHLADSPLEAVRSSSLARADQLQLLEAALEMPGGLGEAALAEQVFDCGLLAADDPDFAFEVALRLCEQLDTPSTASLVRQLRAALLPQVVASIAAPDGAAVQAKRLDQLARLYERAGRSLWIARTQRELEVELEQALREHKGQGQRPATAGPMGPGHFLASEAALMRGGPHADLLEPLAAKLEALAVKVGGMAVPSSL